MHKGFWKGLKIREKPPPPPPNLCLAMYVSTYMFYIYDTMNFSDCTFIPDLIPSSCDKRTEYTKPEHGKRFPLYFLYREGTRSLCESLTSCPRRDSAKITTGLESTKLEITQTYAPWFHVRRSTNCVQPNCRPHTTTRPAAKIFKPGALPVKIRRST